MYQLCKEVVLVKTPTQVYVQTVVCGQQNTQKHFVIRKLEKDFDLQSTSNK